MLEYDYQFKGILYEILFNGTDSTDRTGVGVSLFDDPALLVLMCNEVYYHRLLVMIKENDIHD